MDKYQLNLCNIIFNEKKYILKFNKNKSIPCSYLQNYLNVNNEVYKIRNEEKIYNSNT